MLSAGADRPVWLSGTDVDVEGVWRWQEGDKFSYYSSPAQEGGYVNWISYFGSSEPNNYRGAEDCMTIHPCDPNEIYGSCSEKAGKWNDVKCTSSHLPICRGGSGYEGSTTIPQSRAWGKLSLGFSANENKGVFPRSGANVLSPDGIHQMMQVEDAVVRMLRRECLLVADELPQRCVPPQGISQLFVVKAGNPNLASLATLVDADGIGRSNASSAVRYTDLCSLSDPTASAACVETRLRNARRVHALVESLNHHQVALLQLATSVSDGDTEQLAVMMIALKQLSETASPRSNAWSSMLLDMALRMQEQLAAGSGGDPLDALTWTWRNVSARLFPEVEDTLTVSAMRLMNSAFALTKSLDAHGRAALVELQDAVQSDLVSARWANLSISEQADLQALLVQYMRGTEQRLAVSQLREGLTSNATHRWTPLELVDRMRSLLPSRLLKGLSLDAHDVRASAAISELPLAYPLPQFTKQRSSVRKQWSALCKRMMYFDSELASEVRRIGGPLTVTWSMSGWKNWIGKQTLASDLMLAAAALVLVCICICLHTRSLFLGLLGALQIASSFSLALCVYRFVLGITLFGVLHAIGVFVILGIACDDIFVVYDAFTQAAWLAPPPAASSLEGQLKWALHRAGKAILVTTLTDCAAFMSAIFSGIPNLVSFSILTSLLALANLLLAVTLWPCALILEVRLRKYWQCACCLTAWRWCHSRSTVAPTIAASTRPVAPSLPVNCGLERPSFAGRNTSVNSAVQQPRCGAATSPGKGTHEEAMSDPRAAPLAHAFPKHRPRALERWYAKSFVPWLSRPRVAISLVAFSSVVTFVLAPYLLTVGPSTEDIELWPSWHFLTRWQNMHDTYFEPHERSRLVLLWGTNGVDRAGTSFWDETQLGEVRYNAQFDLAAPEVQDWLLKACMQISSASIALHIVPGSPRCFAHELSTWAESQNLTYPFEPRSHFEQSLIDFLQVHPEWLAGLSFQVNDRTAAWSVRHVSSFVEVALSKHAPAQELRAVHNKWQHALAAINAGAPASVGQAVQTAGYLWLWMATIESVTAAPLQVVSLSACLGFLFITCCTCSIRVGMLCTITIVAVVGAWGGFATLFGLLSHGIGFVESLVAMISVGLMLDPLAHIAFAYSETLGSTEQRVQGAFSTIGISVLGSAISTAGPCMVMVFTTLLPFSRFAVLFCSLTGIALFYAHFFLAPLLILLGPSSKPMVDSTRRDGVGSVASTHIESSCGASGQQSVLHKTARAAGRNIGGNIEKRSLRNADSAATISAELVFEDGLRAGDSIEMSTVNMTNNGSTTRTLQEACPSAAPSSQTEPDREGPSLHFSRV